MSRGWDPAGQSLKSSPGRTAAPVGRAWRCVPPLSECPRQLCCELGQSLRNKLSPREVRFLLLLKCGLIMLALCHAVCKDISVYPASLFHHHHECYTHSALEFSGHAQSHLNNLLYLFVCVCVSTYEGTSAKIGGYFIVVGSLLLSCGSGELNLAAGAFTHWSTSPAPMHIHVLTWVYAAPMHDSIIFFSTWDDSWTYVQGARW